MDGEGVVCTEKARHCFIWLFADTLATQEYAGANLPHARQASLFSVSSKLGSAVINQV